MVSPSSWSESIDSLGLPPELEQRRARELAVACRGALLEMGYADYGSPSTSAPRIQFEHSSNDIHQARNEWSPRHWFMIAIVLMVAASISVGVAVSISSSEDKEETTTQAESNAIGQTISTLEIEEEQHATPLVSPIEILQQVPLIDGHNDWPWNIRFYVENKLGNIDISTDLRKVAPWATSPFSQTDIPRLRQGHVGGQFWSVYVPCEAQYLNTVQFTLEQIDVIKRFTNQYQNHFKFVTSSRGIEEAFREGRIASLIGIEGGHSIGNSLAVLRMYYELGVRYLTLTHNCHTPWADSHIADREHKPVHEGLTEFGKNVVYEMNRLGMMVDLARASVKTMNAAIDSSQAPVIFSHSSAYSICNYSSNVRDDILRKVSKSNSIVMVTFNGPSTCCDETATATLAQVADHIDHIRKVAGVNHVGIGGGFDGINRPPKGLEDVSRYPNLLAELVARGWSEDDLKKLVGLNLLRVFREVEMIRDKMFYGDINPIEDFIPPSKLGGLDNCTYELPQ